MALADRIQKAEPKTKFELWLGSLSPANADTVCGWLLDPSQSNASIVRAIREDSREDDFLGYRANKDTIAAWRRKHASS